MVWAVSVEMGRLYRYLNEATHDARAEWTFLTAVIAGTILAAVAVTGGTWYVVVADDAGGVLWGVAAIATAILPAVFAVSGILGIKDSRAERELRTRPKS